jgi:hypothetical protein
MNNHSWLRKARKTDSREGMGRRTRSNFHFFARKKETEVSRQASIFHSQQPPAFYSIKYLGITNGKIGILSKRSPIPHMSPLETCKDVPLVYINSSISNSRSSKHLISSVEVPNKIRGNDGDRYFPNPEQFNEFVVHTYARPRGLNAIHLGKKKEFSVLNTRIVAKSLQRSGITGWKLRRPKTSSARRIRNEGAEGEKKLYVECKHIEVKEGVDMRSKSTLGTRRKKIKDSGLEGSKINLIN